MRYLRADRDGKIAGFKPGHVYRLKGKGRKQTVECLGVEHMAEEVKGPINEGARRYLTCFGLRPEDILKEGDTLTGYSEVVRSPTGERVDHYGVAGRVRKPWPEGFDYDHFVDLYLGVRVV